MAIPVFILAGTMFSSSAVFADAGDSPELKYASLESSSAEASAYFGTAVGLYGGSALVGAYGNNGGVSQNGSAYYFKDMDEATAGSTLTESVKLEASNSTAYDQFGSAVGLYGDNALVGAHGNDDNGNLSGMAYYYKDLNDVTEGSTVTETLTLLSSDISASDYFGYSVALQNDDALVGAESAGTGGLVYYFKGLDDADSGSTVTETLTLEASDAASQDLFGVAVALYDGNALVGACFDDDTASGSGSAYYYKGLDDVDSGSTITETLKLTASDATADADLGVDVALYGDNALVGAYRADNADGVFGVGAAYYYKNLDDADGSSVTEDVKLIPSDGAGYDYFGRRVALYDGNALVGSYEDDDGATASGSAYYYEGLDDVDSGSTVTETLKILASDAVANSCFGSSLSLEGDNFVIGSYEATVDSLSRAGKAYSGNIAAMLDYDTGTGTADTPSAVVISGLSFTSYTNWIIGGSTDYNTVTLSAGDSATVSASGKAVYIGKASGSDGNTLIVAGTLTASSVYIGATDNSGNMLQIEDGASATVSTYYIAVDNQLAVYDPEGELDADDFGSEGNYPVDAYVGGSWTAAGSSTLSVTSGSGDLEGYTVATVVENTIAPASVSTASGEEGDSVSLTVTMSETTTEDTSVTLTLCGGDDDTASLSDIDSLAVNYGDDDESLTLNDSGSVTLTVPTGTLSFTVKVTLKDDSIYEGSTAETCTVQAGSASGVISITDNDSAPTVSSISGSSTSEGTAATQAVTLSNASSTSTEYALSVSGYDGYSYSVSVSYDDGETWTSVALTDGAGTITVPAGVSSFTVKVTPTDDAEVYQGSQSYTVTIGGTKSSSVSVSDVQSAPEVSAVTAASDSVEEGERVTFDVTMDGTAASAIDISLTLGADGDTATIGSDTGAVSVSYDEGSTWSTVSLSDADAATLSVPAETGAFSVKVATTDDSLYEGSTNEVFTLEVGEKSDSCEIVDNDSEPTVSSVGDASGDEGTALSHSVTLSCAAEDDMTFALLLGADTATIGTDTGAVSVSYDGGESWTSVALTDGAATLTVPGGVSTFTVRVEAEIDGNKESDETYTLTVGGASGTGTIYNAAGYSESDPVTVTSSNSSSYVKMSGGTSETPYYYEIGEDIDYDTNVFVGYTEGTNYLNITGSSSVSTGSGDFNLGVLSGSEAYVTVEDGSILQVGGNLNVGSSGAGELYIFADSLVVVDGSVTTNDYSAIYLEGSEDGASCGYLAIAGEYTESELLSSLNLYVYNGSEWVEADTSNLLVNYITDDVASSSSICGLFGDSVSLSGYTVICYSPIDMSWAAVENGNDYWYVGSWYGSYYYEQSYGDYIWHTVHGWQYVYADSTEDDLELWDIGTNSWWYTDSADYPWIFQYTYDENTGSWGGQWYEYESGSSPDRVFYDWDSDENVDESDIVQ